MAVSTDYDYSRFTPLDNTGTAYNIFRSGFKNIRFALPVTQTLQIDESDIGNLAGLAFRIYGDTSLWRMILAYNGLNDPIQDMWPGMILQLPSKVAVISYINEQLRTQQQVITI